VARSVTQKLVRVPSSRDRVSRRASQGGEVVQLRRDLPVRTTREPLSRDPIKATPQDQDGLPAVAAATTHGALNKHQGDER
jgi:hypothetical protein